MYKNKTASLEDVRQVGQTKLVGYKLIKDLVGLAKIDPADLQKELEERGLKTLILTGDDCAMCGGALYAWDDAGLSAFLQQCAQTVRAAGWPVDTEGFIRRLAVDWHPEKTAMFDVISDAFNSKSHPGRTDVTAKPGQAVWSPPPKPQ